MCGGRVDYTRAEPPGYGPSPRGSGQERTHSEKTNSPPQGASG
jgi:hypothetical protein